MGVRRGQSWTEPTCFALLALRSCDGPASAQIKGRQWLLTSQRQDGGWAPEPSIPISTWVTSLAAIALNGNPPAGDPGARAVRWIKAQVGTQSSILNDLRKWFLGASRIKASPEGWSFYPGTASWVVPTVLAIVALSKSPEFRTNPSLANRVADGRRFLLSRRCADGGWSHGGSLARGEGSGSYPETTAMALLAFQGNAPADLGQPLALVEKWLANADSVEAESWIRIALSAHGCNPAQGSSLTHTRGRTNYDRSLQLLAEASRCGINEFATALT